MLGTLIFISGPEGSGTTMLQRVLCESDAALCFFTSPSASAQGLTNTQLLSTRAQQKYALLAGARPAEDEFNEATRALWWDGTGAYASSDADARPHGQRDANITAAGAAACEVLKRSAASGLNITSLVIHRSIPYGGGGGVTGGGMPHLEDLPDLAHQIGACVGGGVPWGARAAFVLRPMADAWMSHGHMGTANATLPLVERHLKARAERGGAFEPGREQAAAPVRFARLLSSPLEELRCLAAAWGGGGVIEPDALLTSPDLLGKKPQARRALAAGRKSPAQLTAVLAAIGDGGTAPAQASLTKVMAAYTKKEAEQRWEETRHNFPTVDAILQSNDGCAQDVVAGSRVLNLLKKASRVPAFGSFPAV